MDLQGQWDATLSTRFWMRGKPFMGDLMQFNVLDTRQYRSDQANGDKRGPRQGEFLDPSRVFMGKRQEDWLTKGMRDSSARWNVMAQQIIMAQFARHTPEGDVFGSDSWDGYPVERNRLMNFLATAEDLMNERWSRLMMCWHAW